MHVLAPFGSASDPVVVRDSLHVHPAGGSLLFGFPGAAARFAENPLRLDSCPRRSGLRMDDG